MHWKHVEFIHLFEAFSDLFLRRERIWRDASVVKNEMCNRG